jgi:hypothetical protein
VLNYPETVTGRRTTPRTLVRFFEQIQGIQDLNAEIELVATLAAACLDETSVAAFVNDDLSMLLNPADILDAKSPGEWQKRFTELSKGNGGAMRLDRIATICTRLFLHVTSKEYRDQLGHAENFAEFLLQEAIPNDLRGSLLMDLSRQKAGAVQKLLRDKRLAKLFLEKL